VGYLVVELYSSHANAAQQEILKQCHTTLLRQIIHKQKEQRKQITEQDKGKTEDKET
jgi:hypothetical protein